jgi:hypothetical protein
VIFLDLDALLQIAKRTLGNDPDVRDHGLPPGEDREVVEQPTGAHERVRPKRLNRGARI